MCSRASVELVLLVPGLLGPAAAGSGDHAAAQALVEGLDLDGLDRLLARCAHTADEAADDSLEALAFRSFGLAAPPAGADWPVAALTALVDGRADEGSGFRLRADPVHLRADIDDLVLFDTSDIDLSPDEAEALVRTVNDALGPDGPCIDAAHPHRWYVSLDAPLLVTTVPLSLAAGAQVSSAMPRGPDAPRWHRWMNEVQMALHECPVTPNASAAGRRRSTASGRGEREVCRPRPGRRRRSYGYGAMMSSCVPWRIVSASNTVRCRTARGSGWTAFCAPACI